jgi:hypothetical protein
MPLPFDWNGSWQVESIIQQSVHTDISGFAIGQTDLVGTMLLLVPAKDELPMAELERLGILAAKRAREKVKKRR